MAASNGPASLEQLDGRATSVENVDDGFRQNGRESSKLNDKERKIGHRRVNEEGEVSYKKIQTNQLMASIQLGIQYSISSLTKFEERDLLMQDFMTVESTFFPRNGSQQTPAHSHSEFTFRTFAPVAFRYFHKLFGIKRDDFLMSICHHPMQELVNPGASGSIFYLTNDDEFILKTVQHKESEFLQKLLPGYFMNLNQNPHTLLPKFFGMFCYHCNQKNIRLTIMNNILPSSITMHLKFDLKGSTYKRKANKREREKKSPTYKDLDFMDILPEGLLLEPETYSALISTLRRDCRVLESFRIMDYSLLIGIHNLDQAAREEQEKSSSTSLVEDEREPRKERYTRLRRGLTTKQRIVAHSTAMESIQAQTDPIDEEDNLPPGGIPARNHKGERLLLYLGIIDILQSYRMRKKLEHTLKAIILDGDTVSVHRPGFYANRFMNFMEDKVFKKIPSPLKHSPSKKGKRESIKKRINSEKENNDQGGQDPHRLKSFKVGSPAVRGAIVVHSPELTGVTSPTTDSTLGVASLDTPTQGSVTTAYEETSQERLNLPAVLWDKPPGSKIRVPPPVPPRSPKRPLDSTGGFPDSGNSEDGNIVRGGYGANQRPDVVPGSIHEEPDPYGGAKGAAKPKHKHLKKLSSSETRSMSEVASLDHGTPSHLSITGGSGWNTPTPTWTEGTPSYTESTKSGSPFEGGLGNTSRSRVTGVDGSLPSHHLQGSQEPVTSRDLSRRLPTCSFRETEM